MNRNKGNQLIITYENSDYPFDFEDITIKQAMAIEKYAGMSFADWGKTIAEGGNLKALQVLGWLVLDGGDLAKPVDGRDFKMARLGAAFADALAAAREAAKAAEDDSPRPTSGTSSGPTEITRADPPPLSSDAGS